MGLGCSAIENDAKGGVQCRRDPMGCIRKVEGGGKK